MNKYEAAFAEINDLVEGGMTISGALQKLGLERRLFYRDCPKRLLTQLKQTKAAHSLRPATSRHCPEFADLQLLPTACLLNPFGDDLLWEQT